MKILNIQTHHPVEMVDISAAVRRVIAASGVSRGAALLFVPHTTAAVTINENADPDVVRDLVMELNRLVPFDDGYRHGEGNSAAHIKSTLVGASLWLIIENAVPFSALQEFYSANLTGREAACLHIKILTD